MLTSTAAETRCQLSECLRLFVPRRSTKKFCSDACRTRDHYLATRKPPRLRFPNYQAQVRLAVANLGDLVKLVDDHGAEFARRFWGDWEPSPAFELYMKTPDTPRKQMLTRALDLAMRALHPIDGEPVTKREIGRVWNALDGDANRSRHPTDTSLDALLEKGWQVDTFGEWYPPRHGSDE